jgi:hypothetical protein
MGDAKRKYNAFIIRLRKGLKRKFHGVAELMAKGFSDDEYVSLFREIYFDDWKQIEEYHKYYKQKDDELLAFLKKKNISNPQPRYSFGEPKKFVLQSSYFLLIHTRKKHDANEIMSEPEREKLKKELLETSKRKHDKKLRVQNERSITIQEVEPEYLDKLEQMIFNPADLIERLNAVKEISKYKNEKTIQMLYAVLSKEKDYFLRQMAFRSLQRFGKVVFLDKKGIGKKSKTNRLEMKLGEFKVDLGKKPDDVLREINEDTIQNFKTFDIFLSHSSKDLPQIINLVRELNKEDLVVYVDWISDREDLKRTDINTNTAEVIKHRMNSSSSLIYAFSSNSVKSEWIYWEVGFFDALSKGICVFDLDNNQFQDIPIFMKAYPVLIHQDNNFIVQFNNSKIKLTEWLQIKN